MNRMYNKWKKIILSLEELPLELVDRIFNGFQLYSACHFPHRYHPTEAPFISSIHELGTRKTQFRYGFTNIIRFSAFFKLL